MTDMPNFLREQGYIHPIQLSTGEWAGVVKMLFTYDLCVGLNETGYRCRWSYPALSLALLAIELWDGHGDDPPGDWVKQKGTDSHGNGVDRNKGDPLA